MSGEFSLIIGACGFVCLFRGHWIMATLLLLASCGVIA